ncbi:hypothetical protein SteCoe_7126 [Stentor coeruleus]|uniref:Kinesin motor domain-containing protein n=1 Tax=Stentor coeruleus TaxID=5963 RepID=A0A1R2CNJ6_9CILI|nr:hypothetical protein SteCoe_7126 [Stentor coeruleus]
MEKNHYKVAVRLKPIPTLPSFLSITSSTISLYNISSFDYDKVYQSDSKNEKIFDLISNYINNAFRGINLSVIAYGEPGSGKTYTIFGDHLSLGLVPITIAYIFNHAYRENYTFSCSMIGIDQDRLIDFLQEKPQEKTLKITKDVNGGVLIENLAEIIVEKEEDCYFLIKKGLKTKKDGKYSCDTVFQILIESLKADNRGFLVNSKMNFCDLNSNKSSKNLQSLNSVITCLSNNVTVPYRDSPLTKILSDTLTKTSNAVIIFNIIPYEYCINSTLQTLNIANLAKTITTTPKKNETQATNFHVLKKLHNDIIKLKNALRAKRGGKNLHEEVNMLKKETDKLKEILNEQSTVQEVEELIQHNKNLRIQLQNLVGCPIAESDVELPDSVSVLQKALVLTEDMIKKRKLYLTDQEMKAKLVADGRCTICTLKVPCKHRVAYSPKGEVIKGYKGNMKCTGNEQIKGKIGAGSGNKVVRSSTPSVDERFIENAEEKIKLLSKIEAYKEKKVMKEIEKAQEMQKIEDEMMEKMRIHEEWRRKYLEKNKEKIKAYKEQIGVKRQASERRKRKKTPSRPQSSFRISNYYERKKSIVDLLREHSKVFMRKSTSRIRSLSNVNNSVDSLSK